MLYLIPDKNHIERSLTLAEKYGAAFEYNDFFSPEVLESPEKTDELIAFYTSLPRRRNADTLHGAFFDVVQHSDDPKMQSLSLERIRHSLSAAKRLGVRAVIFHTNLIANFRDGNYIENWIERNYAVWTRMLSEYPETEIYLENMFDCDHAPLLRLAQKMEDQPRFGVCLDYAHACVFGEDPEEFASALLPYVKHVHVNDNDLRSDAHAAVGKGSIDWESFDALLRSAPLSPSVLIEVSGEEEAAASAGFMKEKGIYPFPHTEAGPGCTESAELPVRNGRSLGSAELREIIGDGIRLTTEKDKNRLLERLLSSAMEISRCDAGTLYLYREDKLFFKVMKTLSQGVSRGENGEEIELPPVPLSEENVCAYSALRHELVNIADVYHSEAFDFSGPKKYDAITGYRTRSMLVIPLEDGDGTLVGVLQLINAEDEQGNTVPFSDDDEFVIRSLGAMTAVSLLNMLYIEQIKDQLNSFVSAFAAAVDERTPYNGSHTRKVTAYTSLLAGYINRLHDEGKTEEYFDPGRTEQLVMAAALHDIGKMVVPLSVMNKESRLGQGIEKVRDRFALLGVYNDLDLARGRIGPEEHAAQKKYLSEASKLIEEINFSGFLPDEKLAAVKELAGKTYSPLRGEPIRYLTDEEENCLSIRRGTLTAEERGIMESHAAMTGKILSNVHFSAAYADVPRFASEHHEMLDGSGYPLHLTAENIGPEPRILAVTDIYDALTSSDRPYKKPIPKQKAFEILFSMADEGKLERKYVSWLKEALEESGE